MTKINLIQIFFTILLILPSFIRAGNEITGDKVYLLNLNYDNGRISLNNLVIKTGYAPDRRLQPMDGFKADVVSFGDKVIYSFRFNIPLKINTDVIVDGEVSGNVIILNQTNFALLVPYYKEAKEINIYDKKDNKILSANVYKPSITRKRWAWAAVIGVGGIMVAAYVVWKKKRLKFIK